MKRRLKVFLCIIGGLMVTVGTAFLVVGPWTSEEMIDKLYPSGSVLIVAGGLTLAAGAMTW